MNKAIVLFAILFLAGCQADQVQPTAPLPVPEPAPVIETQPMPVISPEEVEEMVVVEEPEKVMEETDEFEISVDAKGPKVLLTGVPDVIMSGEPAQFDWIVEGGQVVEHTNIHTSFTPDFAERVDSEKQPGTSGMYSDMLTLESETSKTIYIKAHANVDGVDYNSDVVTRELQVASNQMQGGQNTNADIAGFSFNPDPIRVKAGDTVVWTQKDGTPHTVTITDGPQRFDSGIMRQDDTFSHKFTLPGKYMYKCSLHPTMRGTIIVE